MKIKPLAYPLFIPVLILVGVFNPTRSETVRNGGYLLDSLDGSLTVPLASFTVHNLNDGGPGSLRQAILDANTSPGGDAISFDPSVSGTITLTMGQLTISDDLTINGPGANLLIISGNDATRVIEINVGTTVALSGLTISRGKVEQGAHGGGIFNNGTVMISNCTLSDNSGNINSRGGAIFNSGTLTLTDSTLSGNSVNHCCLNAFGGGIYNTGTATISNSNLSGNTANGFGGRGGGMFIESGTVTINNSTLSGNTAKGSISSGGGISNFGILTIVGSTLSGNFTGIDGIGGGITNSNTLMITNSTLSNNSAFLYGGGLDNSGTATISNSTVSDNSCGSRGGGIHNFGDLRISNSTLSGNSSGVLIGQGGGIANFSTAVIVTSTLTGNIAGNAGGGIYNPGTTNIKNSIVADSQLSSDCAGSGTVNASGVNFSTGGTCPGFTQVPSTGPGGLNLGPLANNGGPTQTHALLSGSIAIDAATDCTDLSATPGPVTADQRGLPRPLDGDGDGVARCDVGAYEAPAVVLFDLCIRDDSKGSIFEIESATGDYQFTSCSGFTLRGTGSLIVKGGTITLQHYSSDRRVLAKIDSSMKKGTASIQVFGQGIIFTIIDRNTMNNMCACTAQ